jgi:hypothetical protein
VGVTNHEEEWQIATREFLASPEGQNWKGANLSLVGYLLHANGLTEAEDKVAALKSVAAEMKDRGLDVVSENKVEIRADASPAEIIEKWKVGYGDPIKAGEAFRNFFKK